MVINQQAGESGLSLGLGPTKAYKVDNLFLLTFYREEAGHNFKKE